MDHNTVETPLQKETQLFRDLFARLINAILNRIFDLRPEKAARRLRSLILLFVIAVFVVSLRFYPLDLWTKYVRDIFLYYLTPGYSSIYVGNPLVNFVGFVWYVFADPRIFQYVPILLAPFFIALQAAALYLADIFELEHVRIARGFIWSVALSGSEETIRVSQGGISEEDRHSPTFLIGGPGKVIVDLDSVAMFEKPDGTPHIIGPTNQEPRARATLEGFERFRQAIDTRDHYVDLRDQDNKSQSVKSRSLDGIPITATDVHLMFSVYRGGVKPSTENPYPFSKEAIEQIIYQATSRVTPDLRHASTYEFSWINRMIGLIRGELGAFMNRHKLTAYLANIGMPELEKIQQREEGIFREIQKIVLPEQEITVSREPKNPLPEFQPRHKISNLFTQFADEFTKKTQSNGVELHWIGVGTWETPVEIVTEEHLEAWKLSNDNLYRESPEALHRLENESIQQKTIMLIQDVPIAAYSKAHMEENESKKAMRSLLLAYQQQLLEAAEFMHAKGEAVPPNIEEAIAHINNMFGHFL
ncbi:MAG TPA: hypothetical protein VFG81_01560 [Anaerolineales bacterium]|jgi:hypothetical protein|nr:hypothetical protein [Anaerolineales bacterium]